MPTKTTSNKPKNKRSNLQKARPKAPTPKKTGTSKYIFIGLAALVVLGGLMWWLPKKGEVMDIQKNMETYLEDKYNKDFVVEKPELTGAGLAVTGSWRADAHPADDKSLAFRVSRDQVDESRFFDTYTGAVWEREERPRVEAVLKELYGAEVPEFSLSTNISMQRNEPNPIRGDVPSIDAAIQQYGDQFYYSLRLRGLTIPTMTNEEKESIRTKFKTIYDYVVGRGMIKAPELSISISAVDEDLGYVCSTSDVARLGSLDAMLDDCLSKPAKQGVY